MAKSQSVSPARPEVEAFLQTLQNRLIEAFEAHEPTARFTRTPWTKPAGEMLQGGGTMALMRGDVFEKVGVNLSIVHGTFSEQFRNEIPGALESNGAFHASGVSIVAHPANPHVPAVHLNVRRIETSRSWFAGGADLTPSVPYPEDTKHFHSVLETISEKYRKDSYKEYKDNCDKYFFLPHRNEARGVGGIFFDYIETQPTETFTFVQDVGLSLLDSYFPLVSRRNGTPITPLDRAAQIAKRGRYAEFNLIYDRGTRFGLQTGGNPDAILMSLPPLASW